MSKELRASTEQHSKFREICGELESYLRNEDMWDGWDAVDIATRLKPIVMDWRAGHPADDDEQITKKWLIEAGGRAEDHPDKVTFYREDSMAIGLWSVDDGWKVMLMHAPDAASCIVRGMKNRGDVRRLFTALKVSSKR